MKQVLMMMQETCPYCRKARAFMDELRAENPDYAGIDVKMVDENIEVQFADSLDYYYVPTYYVDGIKLYEGAVSKDDVRAVFDAALK
ncbi:MAG: glutaredoxin [Butyrivibrio sp.]|jgi:glutaredoxin|nr:glutaredoxin [Butyrivibrio sp.]